MRELNTEAVTENLPQVLEFVDSCLESTGCSVRTQTQIAVSVEEIFVNIAHYAYTPKTGGATVRVEVSEGPTAVITFLDCGTPYNPLARADPNITLSAEERPIGGLGIYMTKKFMDDVTYAFQDGKNILTLKKKL